MLNPKNIASLLIVVLSFFAFTQTTFAANAKTAKAKVAAKKSVKKGKLQFDPQVYYKLSHKRRAEYLQVFIDLAVKAEQSMKSNKKTAMNDFYEQLQDILFPRAEANGAVCLNGGIFYDRPASGCGSVIPESHRFTNLAPYYSCGMEKRCAAYFGVDNSGQGFCYSNSSSATAQCAERSAAGNGRANLAALLASNTDPTKTAAFRDAMAKDQEKIEQYCNTERNAASYCQAARTALTSFSSDTDGAVGNPAPSAAMLDARSGCNESNLQALSGNSFGSLERQLNFPNGIDNYWMYLSQVAQHACGTYRDQEDILKVVGVCGAPSTTVDRCQSRKEELSTCINTFYNTRTLDEVKAQVIAADPSLCNVTTGSNTCREGLSLLAIRNRIANGDLAFSGGRGVVSAPSLEKVAEAFCPSPTRNFSSCRAANPVGTVAVSNPANVRQYLDANNKILATGALDAMIAGREPTSQQMGAFAESFGLTVRDFKGMFCATSTDDFIRARTGMGAVAGSNEMRARMRACADNSVRNTTRADGTPVSQSNYSSRSCSFQPVTGVVESMAGGYLYYERSTGFCRKSSGIVSGTSVPRDAQIAVPCRQSDLVGMRSSQKFVRLDHAIAGGSDVPPVYACLDNIISARTPEGTPVFDVSRASCSATDNSGDGPSGTDVGQ